MEGRIRFITAITPTYAHAYQTICLASRSIVVCHQKFRSPAAKARYPHLPDSPTTTRERGNEFPKVGPFTLMEEPALLRVRPLLAGA